MDALAVETLPTARELEAVVAELNSMGATTPTWFSFTPAPGGRTTRTGEPLADLAALAATARVRRGAKSARGIPARERESGVSW